MGATAYCLLLSAFSPSQEAGQKIPMVFGAGAVYNTGIVGFPLGILNRDSFDLDKFWLEASPVMLPARCHILCVDDHEDTSYMLTHLLEQSNYEVVTAGSIRDALRLIEEEKFDLYILDKRLPDGSGLDLCRRFTALTPHVPVIFYSGDAYELHRQEGLYAGAEAYVPKPEIDKLIEAVGHLLADKDCAAAAA